ncbi:MAG: hypothetical protein AB1540_00275 [Bdellovibrionota bacterium]
MLFGRLSNPRFNRFGRLGVLGIGALYLWRNRSKYLNQTGGSTDQDVSHSSTEDMQSDKISR